MLNRILLALAIATPASALAQASDGRIAVVRMQDALTGCKEGKAARKRLEADFKGKQNKLRNREAALKRRYAELEKKQKAGATEESMRGEFAQFQKSLMEAQQLRAQLQKALAVKEGEMTRGILKKMRPLLQRIARKQGFTVILDAGQAVYYPEDLDVTDKLIAAYDKEYR
jgi:outer membrane protein